MPRVTSSPDADPDAPFRARVEHASGRVRRYLSRVGVDGDVAIALKPGSDSREFTLRCAVDGLDWEFVTNSLGDSLHFRNDVCPGCSVYAGDIPDLLAPPGDEELLARALADRQRGGFRRFTLEEIEAVVRENRDWIATALAGEGMRNAGKAIRAINERYFDIVRSLAPPAGP
jgi:hypothetical protein